MIKSLPERLREAAAAIDGDKSCQECAICAALYPDVCSEHDWCSPLSTCLDDVLKAVADEVERDYVPVPDFKHKSARGPFIEWMRGIADEMDVLRVETSFNHADDERKLTIYYEPKRVDNLSDIRYDATHDPIVYCCDHAREDVSNWDQSDYTEWMILDLLRRQREVLERDAEKPEERTCENVAAYFGDFECSECGSESTARAKYCPGCGAKVV